MTKMIKMSLIAAVAVTSMTSVASAQNLEDAIKGVDFSGNLRYRYTNGEANALDQNEYRFEATVKSKINDMATANVSISTKSFVSLRQITFSLIFPSLISNLFMLIP